MCYSYPTTKKLTLHCLHIRRVQSSIISCANNLRCYWECVGEQLGNLAGEKPMGTWWEQGNKILSFALMNFLIFFWVAVLWCRHWSLWAFQCRLFAMCGEMIPAMVRWTPFFWAPKSCLFLYVYCHCLATSAVGFHFLGLMGSQGHSKTSCSKVTTSVFATQLFMPHLAHMVSVLTGLFIPMSVPVHLFCFPFLQDHQSWGFIPDSRIVVSVNIASHFAFLPSLAILDSWPDCATGLHMWGHGMSDLHFILWQSCLSLWHHA